MILGAFIALVWEIHDNFDLDTNKIQATITDNGSNFAKSFKTFGIHPESIETQYSLKEAENKSSDKESQDLLVIEIDSDE